MKRLLTHSLLFAATFGTATWMQGPVYASAIMGILLAHEMGHFLTCRRYGIPASFPVFIPMPNLLGTLGALIAIKGRIPNRKALFDIGVSGPLAGLAFAIPAILIGLHYSTVMPKPTGGLFIELGEPVLFTWLARWVVGEIPKSQELFLHPLAFAGWAVFFVTSINLFPAGQLDGGHILHSLLGRRRARLAGFAVVASLVTLGLKFHPMWFVFAALVLLASLRLPRPTDETEPPGAARILLALFTYALAALCFTPTPIQLNLPGG